MTGAISQDWESCQFPFVLDEKATVVASGAVGKRFEFRTLYVSARTRTALIDAGLFSDKMFFPIRVLDRPQPGVELLDSAEHPLKTMYTPAELEALHAQERTLVTTS